MKPSYCCHNLRIHMKTIVVVYETSVIINFGIRLVKTLMVFDGTDTRNELYSSNKNI